MSNTITYKCDSLFLAAAFLSHGLTLVAVNKDNPRRPIFEFAEAMRATNMAGLFINEALAVDAKKYTRSLVDLNDMLSETTPPRFTQPV